MTAFNELFMNTFVDLLKQKSSGKGVRHLDIKIYNTNC